MRGSRVTARRMKIIDCHKLTKEDKKILDPFFQAQYHENSHLNFTNFFMWREPYHIHWAIEDEILYLTAKWDGHFMVLQPFGPPERMAEAVGKQLEWFKSVDQPFRAFGLEASMAEVYKSYPGLSFSVKSNRDDFDYLYRTEDLIQLSGRKYHSKKNHLNSFRKDYAEAEYLPITPEIVPECKLNINAWYKMRSQDLPDDPFLAVERAAVIEVLNNFTDFKLKGGAIAVEKRIVAFTFGEQLNSDTTVIHVEKADPSVRGAYPAINQAFLEHEWSHLPYVNRQEDMGIEGMRKAKESYKPIRMIEKFTVELQP